MTKSSTSALFAVHERPYPRRWKNSGKSSFKIDMEYEGYLRQVNMLNNMKRKLKQVYSKLPREEVKLMG